MGDSRDGSDTRRSVCKTGSRGCAAPLPAPSRPRRSPLRPPQALGQPSYLLSSLLISLLISCRPDLWPSPGRMPDQQNVAFPWGRRDVALGRAEGAAAAPALPVPCREPRSCVRRHRPDTNCPVNEGAHQKANISACQLAWKCSVINRDVGEFDFIFRAHFFSLLLQLNVRTTGLPTPAHNQRRFMLCIVLPRGLRRRSRHPCPPKKSPLTAINLSPAFPSSHTSVDGGHAVAHPSRLLRSLFICLNKINDFKIAIDHKKFRFKRGCHVLFASIFCSEVLPHEIKTNRSACLALEQNQ